MKRILAAILLAGLSALMGATLAAQELDELRPGMTEAEAIGIYTRYRTCANYLFEELPSGMAWGAQLLDRDARVEVGIEAGKVISVTVVFPLSGSEAGDELLEAIAAETALRLGRPDKQSSDETLWTTATEIVAIERERSAKRREIRFLRSAKKPR